MDVVWGTNQNSPIKTESERNYAPNTKLPIGMQDFEAIRSDGYLYVDKTEYIYKLVHYGKPYFLSRPRRFGKSLLLSTIAAYWEGKKHLFKDLAIESLEKDNPNAWESYAVLYFDFNKANYYDDNALENVLDEHLRGWEKEYKCVGETKSLSERFRKVIENAFEKTKKQVVVLVDEYDKPLLDIMDLPEKQDHNRSVFKGFFSTLKSYDRYLKFVFVTGVTKFSKVSIFSDLNQLQDISMDKAFSGICGITSDEINIYFRDWIENLAQNTEESIQQCKDKLKSMYDGYKFHYNSEGVFNPFSIMNAFKKCEYGEFWFDSGTPTFLVNKLVDLKYDVQRFTSDEYYVSCRKLSDYTQDDNDPLPLLYQTGYLTIKGYDKEFDSIRLNYPNDEVKYAFLETLFPACVDSKDGYDPTDIRSFGKDIENADFNSMRKRFQQLFERLPYPVNGGMVEWSYQVVVYIVFTLLGKRVQSEVHTIQGRVDCIVETRNNVYIFEFKIDKSSQEALKQIDERNYTKAYSADSRNIYRIGVNFNSKMRNIDEWEVKTC